VGKKKSSPLRAIPISLLKRNSRQKEKFSASRHTFSLLKRKSGQKEKRSAPRHTDFFAKKK